MIAWLHEFGDMLLETLRAVTPIIGILVLFQLLVIRKPLPHPGRILAGFVYVLLGIALFLVGLKIALFPIGNLMAQQLTAPNFLGIGHDAGRALWHAYVWVYLFAGSIGFATAMAEPTLIAVAVKASEVSAGSIRALPLRLAVAIGVGSGLALGTFRIVTGAPTYAYILTGYALVAVQTAFAPKVIVGLAYDAGNVASSTVTVPIVTALGLGLASAVPGRNPLLDGFGLIAFTCLIPIITVLGYAQIAMWWSRRNQSTDD
ncbi:DUF1538 domain-containing protein [Methylocaldum sp. MU1018]